MLRSHEKRSKLFAQVDSVQKTQKRERSEAKRLLFSFRQSLKNIAKAHRRRDARHPSHPPAKA